MYQTSPEYTFRRHRRNIRNLTTETQKCSKFQVVKESIKAITKEYCAESSICGLKHLVDVRTPYVERIIWIVTMIGALICSVSLVWLTFRKYFLAPLVTTQVPEGVPVTDIIFPAIGVCSTNRISKKAVTELAGQLLKEERNKMYNETEMLKLLFGLGRFYDLQYAVVEGTYNPTKLHRALGHYEIKDLLKKLTPRCEDIMLNCVWNEEVKRCKDLFDFRLTMNGFCCTFNYLRNTEDFEENSKTRSYDMYQYGNKSAYDYDQGLKMLLKFNMSDDFYYNVPLLGAVLQFSDAYDFPDAPSGSFANQIISTSVQMTVLVSPSVTEASRDIQHVQLGLRGCLFYDESPYLPFYTHSDCMLKCRLYFILERCNCTPFNMPDLGKVRNCNLLDIQCLRKYYAQSISNRPAGEPLPPELELEAVSGGISCPMCYPTCSKTTYGYEFNNVMIYSEYFTNDTTDQEYWLQGINFTDTSIVHVKYAREAAYCYGQNVIMKWFDLFSNIGSTCGFVTGFSFVSVLEFIYFFTVRLIREIRARQQKSCAVEPMTTAPAPVPVVAHNVTVRQVETMEPVTRYHPIYWDELARSTRGNVHFN